MVETNLNKTFIQKINTLTFKFLRKVALSGTLKFLKINITK